MRISKRGQITIPKALRDQFGLNHNVEIEITPNDRAAVVSHSTLNAGALVTVTYSPSQRDGDGRRGTGRRASDPPRPGGRCPAGDTGRCLTAYCSLPLMNALAHS